MHNLPTHVELEEERNLIVVSLEEHFIEWWRLLFPYQNIRFKQFCIVYLFKYKSHISCHNACFNLSSLQGKIFSIEIRNVHENNTEPVDTMTMNQC